MTLKFLPTFLALALGLIVSACDSGMGDDDPLPPNPQIQFVKGGDDVTVEATACTVECTVKSNLRRTQMQVRASQTKTESGQVWCTVELKESFTSNDGLMYYTLTATLDENTVGNKRSAVVVLSSTDGSAEHSFLIEQKACEMTLSRTALGLDKRATTANIKVSTQSTWEAACTADWCQIEQNGNYLTVSVPATTVDRETRITFKGRDDVIVVRQSKYAVGDTYNEQGTTGTVGYIGDDKRFIYRLATTEPVKWSTTGDGPHAYDKDNGEANTNLIKTQSSWRSSYPAFAKVDELNTGGVTGWYMPAINELDQMLPMLDKNLQNRWGRVRVFSSTEAGGVFMDCCWAMKYQNSSWERGTELKTQLESFTYAIRQF